VLETYPIKYLHKYLVAKHLASPNLREFKTALNSMWFQLYRRKAENDSSAFEHVFVGEERDGKIIGFHNWIQFFLEELKGKLNYLGFILPRRHARGQVGDVPDGDEHVISLQFSWVLGEVKSVSTTLIGVSPEFEIALYTLVFLVSGEFTEVVLDGFRVGLRCHRFQSRGAERLGSAFPELIEE